MLVYLEVSRKVMYSLVVVVLMKRPFFLASILHQHQNRNHVLKSLVCISYDARQLAFVFFIVDGYILSSSASSILIISSLPIGKISNIVSSISSTDIGCRLLENAETPYFSWMSPIIMFREGSPTMFSTLLKASRTRLLSIICEMVSYRLPANLNAIFS